MLLKEAREINKAIIIGNLTKDPDFRITSSGISVCTFTVAVPRNFKSASGEKQIDYIPVVVWRGLAENSNKYLTKGKKVAVIGAINTITYDAKDGTKRYVTEITADEVEFLSSISKQETKESFKEPEEIPIDEKDLPF